MILDSSAIISVLFEEEGSERLAEALGGTDVVAIGAPTLLETQIVAAGRFGLQGRGLVAQFLERWSVIVTPFDGYHSQIASQAFVRFGKGRHPAGLNYGDCMTYAVARLAEMPLLCTGDDFRQTDLAVA